MTTILHTPGPWQQHWQYIVAPDLDGVHPDIYIAEIADEDSEGRIAPPDQQQANGWLIAAAPALLEALRETLSLLSGCMRNAERLGQRAFAAKIGTMISVNRTAVALATDGGPPWDNTDTASTGDKQYSLLLLYPDYANDSGTETYYAFVDATDAIEAVAVPNGTPSPPRRASRSSLTISSRCW